MNTVIDMRSDTLTRPTESMRNAMAAAEVGDDVFGEDPTVIRLEQMAAEITGKAAALFVASGTMANLVSVLTHCGRGDEIILGDQAHVFFYEQGGCAALGGIHPRTVPNRPDGTIAPDDITAAVRKDDVHFPRSRLVLLENTHNRCMGSPLDADYVSRIGRLARDHDMGLHVDGARIFNAAVALGQRVSDLVEAADSVSFCLSKGLGAPVGSLVCGDADFIRRARRNRKVVGGGMRQAGVLAAAGIHALEHHVDRLAEDHVNAATLAAGLAGIPGLTIDPAQVKTNIVFFRVTGAGLDADTLVRQLAGQGIKMMALGPELIRAVTHLHISAGDIDRALGVFADVLG